MNDSESREYLKKLSVSLEVQRGNVYLVRSGLGR
jgi:hypothetical protein